jgi:hypothetical protein
VHVVLLKNINLYVYLQLLTLKFVKYKQHALLKVLVSLKEFRLVSFMILSVLSDFIILAVILVGYFYFSFVSLLLFPENSARAQFSVAHFY